MISELQREREITTTNLSGHVVKKFKTRRKERVATSGEKGRHKKLLGKETNKQKIPTHSTG